MDYRELDVIDHIINNFTETNFGVCASIDTDFFYDPEEDDVTYAFVVSEKNDRMFMECVHSIAPNLTCDIFLLSVLHEIGHHYTWDIEVYCEKYKISYSEDGEDSGAFADIPYYFDKSEGNVVKLKVRKQYLKDDLYKIEAIEIVD